jgi:hypothetical protein
LIEVHIHEYMPMPVDLSPAGRKHGCTEHERGKGGQHGPEGDRLHFGQPLMNPEDVLCLLPFESKTVES